MDLNAPPQPPPTEPPPTQPPPTSGPPPPGEPPPPFWRVSRLVVPDADASGTSQVATYLVAVYALGLVVWVLDVIGPGMVLAAALGAGALVGATVPGVRRTFRHASGLVLGGLTGIGLIVVLGVASAVTGITSGLGSVGILLCLGVGTFVGGLDWCDVGRLRALAVLAGLPVLAVSLSDQGPMLVFSLGWLALAVLALWSLECDQRAAYTDPRSLQPGTVPADGPGSRDLAGALLLALAVGLLFAFSASMPSCSPNVPGADRLSLPSLPGGLDLLRYGFDLDGPQPEIDIDGVPYRLHHTPSGHMVLENLITGETFPVFQEGDLLVARDRFGDVVAVIRPVTTGDEVSESPPPSERDWSGPLRVLGLVVVAAALAALAWWWLRRRRPPPAADPREWAEDQVRRLDRLGQRHGADRNGAETVVCHTHRLAEGPVPDHRLHEVGRVLSDALFGRSEPPMATRLWVEQVIDQASEAHPPPGWRERRRRRRDQAPTIDRTPVSGR